MFFTLRAFSALHAGINVFLFQFGTSKRIPLRMAMQRRVKIERNNNRTRHDAHKFNGGVQ